MEIVLLSVVFIVFFLWNGVFTVLLFKERAFLRKITMGINKKDLRELLVSIQAVIDKQEKNAQTLLINIKKLQEEGKNSLQHTALVRYNPFNNTGGDQSFVLALLNAKGDGFVITSLHSRENTRVYAKTVQSGSTGESFSKEEQDAIAQALKTVLKTHERTS